jgi:glucosamine-6-phosphate deaminase
MKIIVTRDIEDTALKTAEIIMEQVREKPGSRLGLATGSTAERIYAYIVQAYKDGKTDFSKVKTVNLDEYIGLSPEHPQSYRASMNRWLFSQVNIDIKNTVVAPGMGNPDECVLRFRKAIRDGGPIDLQLLGVGISGHIGFNEPGDKLYGGAHIEKLTDSTIAANSRFFSSEDEVPKTAITMGIGDIMKAGRIVLAAMGEDKADAMRGLLVGDDITCRLPVSMLKMHPDVTVILDRELAELSGYKS